MNVGSIAYDPCTSLPDQEIATFGLDPGTKKPYGFGSDQVDEVGCSWAQPGSLPEYGVSLGKSARTFGDYKANPAFTTEPASVAGREALNFARNPGENPCNLAFPISGGVAVVAVIPYEAEFPRTRSCDEAQRIADQLAPQIE